MEKRFLEHEKYNCRCIISEENYDEVFRLNHGMEQLEKKRSNGEVELMFNVEDIDGFYISKLFEALPSGLVNKRITGFGATTLEMRSKRNSIIVTPTKNLAYSKHKKIEGDSIYVGSEIGDIKRPMEMDDIKHYLHGKGRKKVFVVADSLGKVYDAIGKERIARGDFHIMIDEVDKFMRDSIFRESLSNAMDYYFAFPKENRTLVTATIAEFCDNRIKREVETRFEFSKDFFPKRNINVYPTDNVVNGGVLLIKDMLKKNPHDKILVAYNSVESPLKMLNELKQDKDLKGITWGLACSDSRKNEAGIKGYYVSFNELDGGRLPRQVCFTTSTNFVGIDLEDDYHLVFIADSTTKHHIINQANLVQIYGRNRKKDGVLSESFMFRSRDIKAVQKTPSMLQELNEEDEFKLELGSELFFECAGDTIEIAKRIKAAKEKYYDYDESMGRIASRERYEEKLKEDIIKIARIIGDNRLYIRHDMNGELVPDYFLIDSYTEEDFYSSRVYSKAATVLDMIKKAYIHLESLGINIDYTDTSKKPSDGSEAIGNNAMKKEYRNCAALLNELVPTLKKYENGNVLTSSLDGILAGHLVDDNNPSHNKHIKTMTGRLKELAFFLRPSVAAEEMEKLYSDISESDNIKERQTKEYNNLYNSILFMSIGKSDPFKKKINKTIAIGKRYPKKEALEAFREALLGIGVELRNSSDQALTRFFGLLFVYKPYSERNPKERWEIKSYSRLGIDEDAIRSHSVAAIKKMQKSRGSSSSRMKYEEEPIFKGSGFRVKSEK